MVVGITLFVIAVLVIAIWIIIEVKRLKHKLFAMLLIGFILFSYVSAAVIFRGNDLDLKSPSGIIDATKLYFSWVISISGNFVQITGNAINMDWGTDPEVKEKVDEAAKKPSGYFD
jgi:hypothetical protein